MTFGEETASTTADKDGRWSVEFVARKASFDPIRLSVKSGDEVVTHENILIAGKDRQFFVAQAKVREVKSDNDDIRKECLEVWSEDVSQPVAVRYAWENQPNANAYGLHGLPVAPFRTDNWPFIRAEPSWAPDLEQRKADNENTYKQSEQWRRERQVKELKRKLRVLGVEVEQPNRNADPK